MRPELADELTRRPITVAIVPHTHWDREWYDPFQTFRLRLVKLLDTLLPMLESDPSYSRFMLDGQTAVVDDYLEIRPDRRATLQRLAASGRMSIGPWMVLMDEFMVSGETIVRDLQFGLAHGSELGGAMQIGYLPDMFGHVAQMPQLIRLAGMDHAVVWRGVPAAVEQTAFWWQAPDGSPRARRISLRLVLERPRSPPDDAKGLVLRRSTTNRSSARTPRLDAADERHRPSDAATVARPRRRRSQRDARRVPVRRHDASRSTCPSNRATSS